MSILEYTRRTVLSAVGGAAAAVGMGGVDLGGGARAPEWRELTVRNRSDETSRVLIWVSGQVYADEHERFSGRDSALDGLIVSVTDPRGSDDFGFTGRILAIRYDSPREPAITVDGDRIDVRRYLQRDRDRDGERDRDRDDDEDRDRDRDDDRDRDRDRQRYPSRILLTATADDLNVVVRVSDELQRGGRETRVRLDRGESAIVRYRGNVRELRTANGTFDVDVTQVRP